jgi:hypothetical protein
MPDLNITIVLPSGGARNADIPDDIAVRDLLTELTSLLQLPTVGPDGRPMFYRLDSKALGRELKEDETLASAGVPEDDRLMLTADITAGSGVAVTDSPRMRRLRADYELMTELTARSDLISFRHSPRAQTCRRSAISSRSSARASPVWIFLAIRSMPTTTK